jgi:AcrR family transcriptional regulator
MQAVAGKEAVRTTGTTRTPRRYNSSRRALQAAQTRSDVLAAAGRVFSDAGWSGATVAAIAEEAGVAVETVYNGFGSKAGLLRAAFDAAIVGDADPIPLVDRPEWESLRSGTYDERMQAAVDMAADSYERSARVWRAVRDASFGDEDLEAWRSETELRRRIDTKAALELVVQAPIEDVAFDALWVLLGPGAYLDLVVDAGRSRAEYQRCLSEAIVRLTS